MNGSQLKNKYLKTSIKADMIWYLFMMLCLVATGVARPASASYIQVIIREMKPNNQRSFALAIAICCLIQIVNYGAKFLSALSCMHITSRMIYRLRKDLVYKFHAIEMEKCSLLKHGDVISTIRNDTDSAGQYLYIVFSRIGVSVFTAFFTIIYMGRIQAALTMIMVAVAIAFGIFNQQVLNNLRKLDSKTREEKAHLHRLILSLYYAMDVLRLYRCKEYIQNKFSICRSKLNNFQLKQCFVDSTRIAIYCAISNIMLFAGAITLCYTAVYSSSGIDEIVAYLSLTSQLLVAIEMIFRWSGKLQSSMAGWDRIHQLMELPECNTIPTETIHAVRSLHYQHLSYAHESKQPVLDDTELVLNTDKIHLLFGKSGSGKTTLFQCLMGMFTSCTVNVMLNGSKIAIHQLQGNYAYVPAECLLFEGSIYENMSLFDKKIRLEKCIELAKSVGIHEWISSLPENYNTKVTEGGKNLSGGQRQMICITRALLSERPVIIMDEPFAALDIDRRQKLSEYMRNNYMHRIILYTSHVIEPYMPYDKCFRLHEGKIFECTEMKGTVAKRNSIETNI